MCVYIPLACYDAHCSALQDAFEDLEQSGEHDFEAEGNVGFRVLLLLRIGVNVPICAGWDYHSVVLWRAHICDQQTGAFAADMGVFSNQV